MRPELIDFGFISIRYYGLMYAIALYIGLIIIRKETKRKNLPLSSDRADNFTLVTFFFAIIGARLYYVLFNLGWYFGGRAPWYEFLAVWHGGLAIHGGLIGGFFGTVFFAKRYRVPVLTLTDIVVLCLPLGQFLGRIGNFMNGDAHGTPTTMPWGLIFPHGPASVEYPGIPIHPVMLYESILNLGAFFILWNLRLKNFKSGFLSFLYIIFYSLIRSLVSLFRADDLYVWGRLIDGTSNWFFPDTSFLQWGIRAPHAISVLGIFVSLFFIWHFKLYQKAATSAGDFQAKRKPSHRKHSRKQNR